MSFSVLLCDDDPQMCAITLNIFEEEGYLKYNLQEKNVAERMDILKKQKHHLTMLDKYQILSAFNMADNSGKLKNPCVKGFNFDIVTEQKEAIEKIRKNDYDIIITDCDFSEHGKGDAIGGVCIIEEAFKKKRTGLRLYSAMPPPLLGNYENYSKYKETVNRLGTGEVFITKNSNTMIIKEKLLGVVNEVKDYYVSSLLDTGKKIELLGKINETLSAMRKFGSSITEFFNKYESKIKHYSHNPEKSLRKKLNRAIVEEYDIPGIKDELKRTLNSLLSFDCSITFSSIFVKEAIGIEELQELIFHKEQELQVWIGDFLKKIETIIENVTIVEQELAGTAGYMAEYIEGSSLCDRPYIHTEKRTKRQKELYEDKIEDNFEYVSFFIIRLAHLCPAPYFSYPTEREEWEKTLLEDQIRFISSLWIPYGNRSVELRVLHNKKDTNDKNNYLDIYLIGKVAHLRESTSIELARELLNDMDSFISRTERKYRFEIVRSEEEFNRYFKPFDFTCIKEIEKTVEKVNIQDIKAFLIYPFGKRNCNNKIFENLSYYGHDLLFSVALSPTQLNYWEETELTELYEKIKEVEERDRVDSSIIEKSTGGFSKNKMPVISLLIHHYLMKFKKAFHMKIQVASPVPIKTSILNEIGYELTGGSTENFQIKLPAGEEEEKICRDNLTYCEFTLRGEEKLPQRLRRLQYMTTHDEAISAFFLPVPGGKGVAGVRTSAETESPFPGNLPSGGGLLGEVTYRKEKKQVFIKNEDQRQHIYIVGKTGSGKSTLLKSLIMSRIRDGSGVCLIDPHGDLCDYFLPRIPKERKDDVILLDTSDKEYPVALNMLDAKKKEDREFLLQELLNIFKRLYEDKDWIGPVFEERIRIAVEVLYTHPVAATIPDISRFFLDENFRDFLVCRLKYGDLSENVKQSIEDVRNTDWGKEAGPYTTSKFTHYSRDTYLRLITGQPDCKINIREIMDNKKILLLKLPKGKIGELNCSILGMLILSRLHLACMGRANMPEEKRNDFYCFIDEFQTFTTTRLADILSEARKYRLNMTLAHQHISQLKQAIRDSVMGNIGTIMSFRIGPLDAILVEDYFTPYFNRHELVNLPYWHAICRLLIDSQPSEPFMMKTVLDDIPVNENIAEEIIKNSRERYARPVKEVEEIRNKIEHVYMNF